MAFALDEEKKESTYEVLLDFLGESSEMRGVHSRRHIPPNTICTSIPRQCLITVEMGQATPIGQAILQSDLDLDAPKHIFLMIFLLWDRKVNGANSFFHPYYEILPPTLSNMPIFWSEDELEALQGSYLLQQIADRNAAIQEDYHAICQIAPLDQICTLDEFKWARMCVCSRNFGLQVDGHRTSALVPHADMLNHYRPRETKWTFDEDRQAFTITSLQHIPAGAQVYDSYGQKCNHRFLLNYGFAVEDNRELDGFCPNEVPVELYVDPDDELFQEKLDYWTRGEMSAAPGASGGSGIHWASQSRTANGTISQAPVASPTPVVKRVRVCVSNNENTRLLFSLLRVLACNHEELNMIASDVGRLGMSFAADMNVSSQSASLPQILAASGAYPYHSARSCRDIRHPISLRNERAAMHLLLEVVQRHLNRYPTTLEQDETDLLNVNQFPRFSNLRHAKIQVRGEKVVLHHFANWARASLQVLSVLQDELLAFKRKERTRQGLCSSYEDEVEDGGVEVQLAQPSAAPLARSGSSFGRGQASAQSNARRMIVLEPHSQHSGLGAFPHAAAAAGRFDRFIQQMEDASDANATNANEGIHHTIVRYCADVLGSLRREEFKLLKRQQAERAGRYNSGSSWSASPHRYGRGSSSGESSRPGAPYL
jgi:hypothetical protein